MNSVRLIFLLIAIALAGCAHNPSDKKEETKTAQQSSSKERKDNDNKNDEYYEKLKSQFQTPSSKTNDVSDQSMSEKKSKTLHIELEH